MAAANPLLQFEDQQLHEQNRRLWMPLAANTGISFILLIAVAALMLRPHPIPYVVMVDGKEEPVGAAQPVLGAQALNDAVIKWRFPNSSATRKPSPPILTKRKSCFATHTHSPATKRPRR